MLVGAILKWPTPISLGSITPVATKVHVIVRIFVVLTWMCDTVELV